jgi:hypothetical protein
VTIEPWMLVLFAWALVVALTVLVYMAWSDRRW